MADTALVPIHRVKPHSVNWQYYRDTFIFKRSGFGNTAHSPATYRNAINCFLRYMEEEHVSRPTPDDLYGYLGKLRERNYSVYTIQLYFCILKMYFRYLHEHDENGEKVHIYNDLFKVADIHVKRPNRKVHARGALSDTEIKKLRKYFRGKHTQKAERDRLIIELCLQGGFRLCEIARMRREDIIQSEHEERKLYIIIPFRKGRYSRNPADGVFIKARLYNDIQKYVKTYGLREYIFSGIGGHKGRASHLTTQRLSNLINEIFRAAGVKRTGIVPHSLRHTAGTKFQQKFHDIFLTQQFMGHARHETTMLYLHVDKAYCQNAPILDF